MRYLLNICSRLALILLLATLVCGTTLAGMAADGPNCCGDCCRPLVHHSASMVKVKLLSAKSMNCCSGVAGRPCDISAQSNARGRDLYRAIASTPCSGSTFAASGQTVKIKADHIIIKNPQLSAASPESRPKYIEFQSILI